MAEPVGLAVVHSELPGRQAHGSGEGIGLGQQGHGGDDDAGLHGLNPPLD